jgi:tetratricopeptide (TPR) repeat protein
MQATAGSPIELALTVRGSGNPATVDAPELPGWPDIDVGMPSVETESAVEGSRLEGRATFRWILVPRSDGTLDLGAARLPYFDPDRGAYAVDTLRLGELRIRPGTVAAMAADSEPRGPTLWEPRPPRSPGPRGLADAPLYWAALAGPWLAWLAALAWARRPRRQPSARRAAVGILAAARRDVGARGSEAAPEAVGAVERALEILYGVSLAGLASLERRRWLERRGAPAEVVDGSEAARTALEGARFGGARLDLAVGELERLERAIEAAGSPRGAGAPGSIALALAVAIGAPGAGLAQSPRDTGLRQSAGPTPASATDAWRESNEAYRQGDMAAAARGFEALGLRHEDPRLEANLAAALWRQGRRGEALARYRSALALDPRAPAIRRDEQRLWNELGRPPRIDQPARALAAVRLDELLLLLLAASWVAAGTAAVARTRNVARPVAAAAAAVVIALAVAAALHAMTVERPLRAIAAAGAELRSAPAGEPIGTLPEGAVVRVLERTAEGWRVRAAGHPAGWVAPDRIAPLD